MSDVVRNPFRLRAFIENHQETQQEAKTSPPLIEIAERIRRLAAAQVLVEKQAKDEGLWFIAVTAAEGYLQQELRRLHRVIEGEPP